jgi:hypothetical protein
VTGWVSPGELVGFAGLSAVLFWLIVGISRGWYVPGPTHRREMAQAQERVDQALKDRDEQIAAMRSEMTGRMDNFRADHAVRMTESRADHERQLEALVKVADGIRADFAAVLASKDRDIDQWRGAWQLTDQASREEMGGQMDELIAFARTMQRWMGAFQRTTGVPELDRADHDAGQG